jgi:prephenate dehydrogenase
MKLVKKVAIIGTGLIGGSLALRLRNEKLASCIIGVDANLENANYAKEHGIIDEVSSLEEAISQVDIIVIAIPVDQAVKILPNVLDQIDQQIVFDVGSTKKSLLDVIQHHPKRGRFVATHPMWGTEKKGPSAVVNEAFKNKALAICDQENSDQDAVKWVQMMYLQLGMRILYMGAQEHDLHAAYISHISHITSFALANTVLEKEKEEAAIFDLASAGFESTVRLAKSNPSMWAPIFLQNKLQVLDVLKEHIHQLKKFQQAIEDSDEKELFLLMDQANQIKRIIP